MRCGDLHLRVPEALPLANAGSREPALLDSDRPTHAGVVSLVMAVITQI